ncbi:hypothetical protein FA13DRAFT_875341 [Coprinellus micaceus]|uniref:Uncharacterized protein n=1 Tax=Coprinellus micaceus TaxID=71717 RepID=A0A4Y7T1R9_COPMI|nr:hypothetical protein FA13DRAFT_875341 [Coprinellus micaceus]
MEEVLWNHSRPCYVSLYSLLTSPFLVFFSPILGPHSPHLPVRNTHILTPTHPFQTDPQILLPHPLPHRHTHRRPLLRHPPAVSANEAELDCGLAFVHGAFHLLNINPLGI